MRRRQWFDWHSWVGVNLSIILTFVLLTGTLATVSRELDWLFQPAMRAKTAVATVDLPWGSMLSSFRETFPASQANNFYAPAAPWLAPELIAVGTEGKRFRVFFDAASGRVQGSAPWFNWQRFLREAHRHLMLPINMGLTIVGLLAFPLLLTLISSVYIYRQWWRGFFLLPRTMGRVEHANPRAASRKRRRFWGDLHRLVGVWSLWFVLIIGLTGAWYLLERWGLGASYPPLASAMGEEQPANPHGGVSGPSLDTRISQAQRDYPNLVIRAIRFDNALGLVFLQGQANAVLVRDRANHVAYDHEGALVDQRRGEDLDWHLRIVEAADPLHFGTLGGVLTRLLWGVFGLLMTLLSISGVYVFGLRLVTQHRLSADTCSPLRAALRHPSLLYSVPGVALIGACLAMGLIRSLGF